MTPVRCTQNPTMGEEWRRGWHPEIIPAAKSAESVLIVGAGPAGLECAVALGKRGYQVTLADANDEFGGRVLLESALPGLSAWRRVHDYRMQQLHKLSNVETYLSSEMNLDNIIEFGADRVVIATGAKWRTDGFGRERHIPVPGSGQPWVYSPDDVMNGLNLQGQVVIYDDDHFYLGSVMAEVASNMGAEVTIVTPAPDISHWTHYTLEQRAIQQLLAKLGVAIRVQWEIQEIGDHSVSFDSCYSERRMLLSCDQIIMVTSRQPNDGLYQSCVDNMDRLRSAGISTVDKIGDCVAPGTIAAAVYSGHLWARQLGDDDSESELPFSRELINVSA